MCIRWWSLACELLGSASSIIHIDRLLETFQNLSTANRSLGRNIWASFETPTAMYWIDSMTAQVCCWVKCGSSGEVRRLKEGHDIDQDRAWTAAPILENGMTPMQKSQFIDSGHDSMTCYRGFWTIQGQGQHNNDKVYPWPALLASKHILKLTCSFFSGPSLHRRDRVMKQRRHLLFTSKMLYFLPVKKRKTI